jgi:class 3 adenylate cyclase/ligand-binding sensor domain-containing protein
MLKGFLLLLLGLMCVSIHAQDGHLFVTNFSLQDQNIGNLNYSICQDAKGNMLFANQRGIFIFDGKTWEFIETDGVPLSLEYYAVTDQIFVGCIGDYGYLKPGDFNNYSYQSLNVNHDSIGGVGQILIEDSTISFCSHFQVISHSLSNLEASPEVFKLDGIRFFGCFKTHEGIMVNIPNQGFRNLSSNSNLSDTTGQFLSEDYIVYSEVVNENYTLIATEERLYKFENHQIKAIGGDVANYLDEQVITTGLNLNSKTTVIGTLSGGVVFIDKQTGDAIHTLNYQTGLPDDEIFAISKDAQGGVWVAHPNGFTRVSYNLPLRNYHTYPGIEGNFQDLAHYDDKLFIATSEGLFYLEEVKEFEEIMLYIEVLTEVPVGSEDNQKYSHVEAAYALNSKIDTTADSQERTFIQNIKQRKQKRKEERQNRKEKRRKDKENGLKNVPDPTIDPQTSEPVNTLAPINNDPVSNPQTKFKQIKTQEQKKIYALQSVTHAYKKIEHLDKKVKDIEPLGVHGLLIASTDGLHILKGDQFLTLLEGEQVNFIEKTRQENGFYVATNSGIKKFTKKEETWEIIDLIEGRPFYSILTEHENSFWAGTDDAVFHITYTDSSIVESKRFPIESYFNERVLTRNVFNRPYFMLSTGLHYYDKAGDSIVANLDLKSKWRGSFDYIANQDEITWVYNGSHWKFLSNGVFLPDEALQFLNIFDDIQSIYMDAEKNLWVVNSNQIHKILHKDLKNYSTDFQVYLKNAWNDSKSIFSTDNALLSYDENAVEFELSAPFYLKANNTRYQYLVEGLMDEWSNWNDNHHFYLPYVPPGNYKLKIRAKNAFGKHSNELEFDFAVDTPFYKTWWFILICIVIVIFLLFQAVKLRSRNLKRKNDLLENKIKQRTQQLQEEKSKSEELLLNILPAEVAEELKQKGKSAPRNYESASVLFTDFVGFTATSAKMEPDELIKKLDTYFIEFDKITSRYGIEKIKTIGDAYMCASGIPISNENNAVNLTLAGIEIRAYCERVKTEQKAHGEVFWDLRLGIHSGPLIAGVVGVRKFAYDVWGDTVNTASRIESNGDLNTLNVSEETYNKVKSFFVCELTKEVNAKGKGMMKIYAVNRIKPKYSQDDLGIYPNDALKSLIHMNSGNEF